MYEHLIELRMSFQIYFNSADMGIAITNVLSYDEDGEMVLTFSFGGGIPGTQPSDQTPTRQELNKRIGGGVEHCIGVIRQLVENGTITV
jgi:hypothetical protein